MSPEEKEKEQQRYEALRKNGTPHDRALFVCMEYRNPARMMAMGERPRNTKAQTDSMGSNLEGEDVEYYEAFLACYEIYSDLVPFASLAANEYRGNALELAAPLKCVEGAYRFAEEIGAMLVTLSHHFQATMHVRSPGSTEGGSFVPHRYVLQPHKVIGHPEGGGWLA